MGGNTTRVQAPDEDVWFGGLRWVEASYMQAQRFEDAFYEFQAALAEAETRARAAEDSGQGRALRSGYDRLPKFDSGRPVRVPSVALHMQYTTELDFLIVGLRNVLRAHSRLPENDRPEMTGQGALALLRNMAEHWDDVDGPSFAQFIERHPDLDPHAVAFTNKELWIGGLHGIPLSRILVWLTRTYEALAAALDREAVEYPRDLRASVVSGDDDLEWPPERLWYHWSLPPVEQNEWPRSDMPETVRTALAERFLNRRRRDGTD